MRISCTKCGEELFGAVNRCWQCGTPAAIQRPRNKPPIRRAPVELDRDDSKLDGDVTPVSAKRGLTRIPLTERVVGSSAMAAIGVGGLGCLVGITSYWCILLAVIGLALGIIGMKSVRRDLAATGLVLSVLALFLGFTQIGVDIKAKIESRQILESYDAYDEAQGF